MKHDIAFYMKWVGTCVILIAMVLHVQGITSWNNFLPQFVIIIPGLIYLWLK